MSLNEDTEPFCPADRRTVEITKPISDDSLGRCFGDSNSRNTTRCKVSAAAARKLSSESRTGSSPLVTVDWIEKASNLATKEQSAWIVASRGCSDVDERLAE